LENVANENQAETMVDTLAFFL
jgi:hypothetical protein